MYIYVIVLYFLFQNNPPYPSPVSYNSITVFCSILVSSRICSLQFFHHSWLTDHTFIILRVFFASVKFIVSHLKDNPITKLLYQVIIISIISFDIMQHFSVSHCIVFSLAIKLISGSKLLNPHRSVPDQYLACYSYSRAIKTSTPRFQLCYGIHVAIPIGFIKH